MAPSSWGDLRNLTAGFFDDAISNRTPLPYAKEHSISLDTSVPLSSRLVVPLHLTQLRAGEISQQGHPDQKKRWKLQGVEHDSCQTQPNRSSP